jgi:hypothetical protein
MVVSLGRDDAKEHLRLTCLVSTGIIDGRMIAESIIAAAAELGPMRVPVVVRLQGTNSEAGLKLVSHSPYHTRGLLTRVNVAGKVKSRFAYRGRVWSRCAVSGEAGEWRELGFATIGQITRKEPLAKHQSRKLRLIFLSHVTRATE